MRLNMRIKMGGLKLKEHDIDVKLGPRLIGVVMIRGRDCERIDMRIELQRLRWNWKNII